MGGDVRLPFPLYRWRISIGQTSNERQQVLGICRKNLFQSFR
jgi:hypothetical protein